MIRFEISDARVGNLAFYAGLRDALAGSPQLRTANEDLDGDPDNLSDLNIEGLAFVPRSGQLF
ncbi:hypothetical protein OAH97_01050 [Octadecabacter sp.]|nr:hypothetical protein [Octadecabacter sp.]